MSFSDRNQTGMPDPRFCWWRNCREFDEKGHFKDSISDSSNFSPRIKVLREMERLALISAEGFDDFRYKLMMYRAGDFWLPVGGIKKEDVDLPPIITILLTGLVNSGKSSLVNLMYSVLGRSGLIPFAQTSGESSNHTTMYLQEHNVLRSPRSGFCIYDTRGLNHNEIQDGMEEVSTWLSNGVRHNQPCHWLNDKNVKGIGPFSENPHSTKSRYVKRKVNCVLVVADVSRISNAFKSGDMKSIQALMELFHLASIKNSNDKPILILTHGDTLNVEDRINARVKICKYLEIPETSGAYDIPCLSEQGILAEESDPVTAFALSEAVYRALLQSDRTHLPKKTLKDRAILVISCITWCLASLFAILASFLLKIGHHNKKLKL